MFIVNTYLLEIPQQVTLLSQRHAISGNSRKNTGRRSSLINMNLRKEFQISSFEIDGTLLAIREADPCLLWKLRSEVNREVNAIILRRKSNAVQYSAVKGAKQEPLN